MAWDTSKALRQQVMYCVYVRQYSKEGTFEKVREDAYAHPGFGGGYSLALAHSSHSEKHAERVCLAARMPSGTIAP